MGVADINTGSFQITVLAISDCKKRSLASDRPGASQARRICSCAYLHTGGVA